MYYSGMLWVWIRIYGNNSLTDACFGYLCGFSMWHISIMLVDLNDTLSLRQVFSVKEVCTWKSTLTLSTPLINLPFGAAWVKPHLHIHKCAVSFTGHLIQRSPMWWKQLACIWPYSLPVLAPLMWMPALFFFLLLSRHTRRLFLDAENEAGDPVAQRRTHLAALRWVQLVGVRSSSSHTGLSWAEQTLH